MILAGCYTEKESLGKNSVVAALPFACTARRHYRAPARALQQIAAQADPALSLRGDLQVQLLRVVRAHGLGLVLQES